MKSLRNIHSILKKRSVHFAIKPEIESEIQQEFSVANTLATIQKNISLFTIAKVHRKIYYLIHEQHFHFCLFS